MLPLLAVLPAAGWLGSWVEGSAYGLPAQGAWWGLPAVDEWGQVERRFPLQLLGVLLGLGIPWLLEAWASRERENASLTGLPGAQANGMSRLAALRAQQVTQPGQAAMFCLVGLALTLLGLSFLRGDPTLLWNGLRPETWGALGLLGLSGMGLGWILREKRVKK